LCLVQGNILLGQQNLKIAESGTITTYGPQSFIVTNDTGMLIQEGCGVKLNPATKKYLEQMNKI
jgi:hypothetical protein